MEYAPFSGGSHECGVLWIRGMSSIVSLQYSKKSYNRSDPTGWCFNAEAADPAYIRSNGRTSAWRGVFLSGRDDQCRLRGINRTSRAPIFTADVVFCSCADICLVLVCCYITSNDCRYTAARMHYGISVTIVLNHRPENLIEGNRVSRAPVARAPCY